MYWSQVKYDQTKKKTNELVLLSFLFVVLFLFSFSAQAQTLTAIPLTGGNATLTSSNYAVFGEYTIVATLGYQDSWATIEIKKSGVKVGQATINPGSEKDFFSGYSDEFTVRVNSVSADQSNQIIKVDVKVYNRNYVSPSPTTSTDYCTDDDGGKNYFLRGVVRGKTSGISYDSAPEICLNSTTLEERYCGGTEQYKCFDGCKDGACLSPFIGGTCKDSSECENGFACFNNRCEVFLCPAVAGPVCDPSCPASGYLSNDVPCEKGVKDPHGCGCIATNKTLAQSPIPISCKKEGDYILAGEYSTVECCPGLKLISPDFEQCDLIIASGVCTAKCGDKVCGQKESSLNCPVDCGPAPTPTPAYCKDSDGGLNYSARGFASALDAPRSCFANPPHEEATEDSCLNSTSLTEVYCENLKVREEIYTCPKGCKDGACNPVLAGRSCRTVSPASRDACCTDQLLAKARFNAQTGKCEPLIIANYTESPLPKPCPLVCIPMWEIRNSACVFDGCGSGCGADRIETFETETDCKAKIEVANSDRLSDAEINSLVEAFVRLEVLKTKFDAISRLANEIADYWESVGETVDANKWKQAQSAFLEIKNKIGDISSLIKNTVNSPSPTKSDYAKIKSNIKQISEDVRGILLNL